MNKQKIKSWLIEIFDGKFMAFIQASPLRLLNKRPRPADYHKIILSQEEGNNVIKNLLISPKPLMISRLGSGELHCLTYYLCCRNNLKVKKRPYNNRIRNNMWRNAGFYPADNDSLDAFSKLYITCINHIDIIGVWFNFYENIICERFCSDAYLIPLRSIEPYYFDNPWSKLLENKKVLVIHPFEQSIEAQYKKRKLLFSNTDVLPYFELITLKAVQSSAKTKPGFETWFDAYEHMCDEIKKIDFDIAIIGAGAYGLPLASFTKALGKKAIHMGGATQILFGIKGKRWDQHEVISKLYNEYWVRPLPSERPDQYHKIEKGCYW
jgi:hypothetical protein